MVEREQWKSRFGFLMASMGSAVGLGNVWMFSYRCGKYGGAAFLVPYFIILFLVGIVGLTVEWTLGRQQKAGPIDAFASAGLPGGKYLGWIPIINVFLIFSFYAVIEGWCLKYMLMSFTGEIMGIDAAGFFGTFIGSYEPLLWLALGILATITVSSFGVRSGIERTCKFMMPMLVILLIVLMVRSLTLGGNAMEGVAFLTQPDFSKVTWDVWLNALGQVLFSLSLVGSVMVVYGSYLKRTEDIPVNATITALGNTVISLMCGFVIFPAVFAFGMSPAEGPPLAFITLTCIFQQMPAGGLFASMFFSLLFIAALSSDVSMLESIAEVGVYHFKMGRKKVVALLGCLAFLVAVPCALHGWFLDLMTSVVTTMVLAPIGAVLAAIALVWFGGAGRALKEINAGAKIRVGVWWTTYVKYAYPVIVAIIFVAGFLSYFGIIKVL
jgi:NSS family neurotransmitter:Na+ symporter